MILLWTIFCLVAASDAAPRDQRYYGTQRDDIEFTLLEPIRIPTSNQQNFPEDLEGSHSAPQASYAAPAQISQGAVLAESGIGAPGCASGLVRRADGVCVPPTVNRNLYVYTAPAVGAGSPLASEVPDPQIDLNYVFVRVPNPVQPVNPVVIPPPQQKTAVYLLQENQEIPSQQVIEVPYQPQSPDVFFVNYDEGQNLDLPGGIDLQTALSNSITEGTVVAGSSSAAPNIDLRVAAEAIAEEVADAEVDSASPVVAVVALEQEGDVSEGEARSEVEVDIIRVETEEAADAAEGEEGVDGGDVEVAQVEVVDVRTAPESEPVTQVMQAEVIELIPEEGFSDASSVQRAEPILATSVVGGEAGVSGDVEIMEAVSTRLAVGGESGTVDGGELEAEDQEEEPEVVAVEVAEEPVVEEEIVSDDQGDGDDTTDATEGDGDADTRAAATGDEEAEEEGEAEGDEEEGAEEAAAEGEDADGEGEEGKDEEEEEEESGQGRSLINAATAGQDESTFIIKGTPTIVTLPSDFQVRPSSIRTLAQAEPSAAPAVQIAGSPIPGRLGETRVIVGEVNVIDTEIDGASLQQPIGGGVSVTPVGGSRIVQGGGSRVVQGGGSRIVQGGAAALRGGQRPIQATPASLIGRTSLGSVGRGQAITGALGSVGRGQAITGALGSVGRGQAISGARQIAPTSSFRLSSGRSQGQRLSPQIRTFGKSLSQASIPRINSLGGRLTSRIPVTTIGALRTRGPQRTKLVTGFPRASLGAQRVQLGSRNILRTGIARQPISTIQKVQLTGKGDQSRLILDHLEGRINRGRSLPLINAQQSRSQIQSFSRSRPSRLRVSVKS